MVRGIVEQDAAGGVRRAARYLAIPRDDPSGLRWSTPADVLEHAGGGTFAFAAEVLHFLEGFASGRTLIPFVHILQLLRLLRPRPETSSPSAPLALLRNAFRQSSRDFRNAGAFAAVLCRDVPSSCQPPALEDLWRWLLVRQAGYADPPEGAGEMAPLAAPAFEARVQRVLTNFTFEDIVHWLTHGCGPLPDSGEQLARVVQERPLALEGVLAEVARRERLSGAVPFVAQMVSALTLPPRRLAAPELPLGGYADVAMRGNLEQVLPSQLAYDELEFVRRLAQRELLFFRREDPHVSIREDLVVLLDQGVRTWGRVRLVLTAALMALARLAQRRGVPFLVAATGTQGDLIDPLKTSQDSFGEMLEASDLGPHPGLALERVLSEPAEVGRDVVLLTHPRNLGEADVVAAARTLRPGQRLFALSVDQCGAVRWDGLHHGSPVPLTRFHINLAATPPPKPAAGGAQWRGDVEPVPYPFVFGVAGNSNTVSSLAFDQAAEWLLYAGHQGTLFATRTDGSGTEVLPRGMIDGQVASQLDSVLGVAGGFVATTVYPFAAAFHYDFAARICKVYRFIAPPPGERLRWWYLPWAHTLVAQCKADVQCLHLSTGSSEILPAARDLASSMSAASGVIEETDRFTVTLLPLQDQSGAEGGPRQWPRVGFVPEEGFLAPVDVSPPWEGFAPRADGKLVAQGAALVDASCQGQTLAALFHEEPGNIHRLRLFRGPEGVPLAEFHQPHAWRSFALSCDGQLLARQVRSSQVEVRDVTAGGPPLALTPRGRFHHDAEVELGERWLSLRIDQTIHLLRWTNGCLETRLGLSVSDVETFLRSALTDGDLGGRRVRARSGQPPCWLPSSLRERFRAAAFSNLVAAVDRFSQVAIFDQTTALVAMFFAFRKQVAAWLPDGTCLGAEMLLGRRATPGAAEKIGQALAEAWDRGEGR
jgi:hypothetical protein